MPQRKARRRMIRARRRAETKAMALTIHAVRSISDGVRRFVAWQCALERHQNTEVSCTLPQIRPTTRLNYSSA